MFSKITISRENITGFFTILIHFFSPKITISNHYFFPKSLFGEKNHRFPHYFDSLFFSQNHYFKNQIHYFKSLFVSQITIWGKKSQVSSLFEITIFFPKSLFQKSDSLFQITICFPNNEKSQLSSLFEITIHYFLTILLTRKLLRRSLNNYF